MIVSNTGNPKASVTGFPFSSLCLLWYVKVSESFTRRKSCSGVTFTSTLLPFVNSSALDSNVTVPFTMRSMVTNPCVIELVTMPSVTEALGSTGFFGVVWVAAS